MGETEEDGCVGEMVQGWGPVGETAQLGEGDRCLQGAQVCARQHEGG